MAIAVLCGFLAVSVLLLVWMLNKESSKWVEVNEHVKSIEITKDNSAIIETDRKTYINKNGLQVIRTMDKDKQDTFYYKKKENELKDTKIYVSEEKAKELSKELVEKAGKTLSIQDDEE